MAMAVLPAAGASLRMGRPKLLLPFAGGTVVGSLAASLRAGGVGTVLLVTAPGDDDLRAWAQKAGIGWTINPDPSRGMLSSFLAGIAALGGGEALMRRREPLVLSPADLPALRPETVAALLRVSQDGAPLALPVWSGRRGHPLVIAPGLIPEIETLDLAVGLRQLLDRHTEDLWTLEVEDPGVVQDVDTPEDYQALTEPEKRT
jgi:molybdenum cofactor cytidylyltransferase